MQFYTGTATDVHDLLAKVKIHLEAFGYTINLFQTDQSFWNNGGTLYSHGTTSQKRLHASKGGKYLNFRSVDAITTSTRKATNGIFYTTGWLSTPPAALLMNVGDGYDGTKIWCSQPGTPNYSALDASVNNPIVAAGGGYGHAVGAIVPGAVASYRLFLQDSPFVFWLAIEWTVGKFEHIMACDLEKSGTFDGGLYFSGSCSCVNYGRSAEPADSAIPFVAVGVRGPTAYCRLSTHPDAGTTGWGAPWLRNMQFYSGSASFYPAQALCGDQTLSSGAYEPLAPVRLAAGSATSRDTSSAFGPLHMLLAACPSVLNGIDPMTPLFVCCTRANTRASLLGVVPDVFLFTSAANMDGLERTYGGVTYVCLPLNWHLTTKTINFYFAIRKA